MNERDELGPATFLPKVRLKLANRKKALANTRLTYVLALK